MHFCRKAGRVTGQGQLKKRRFNYDNVLCLRAKGKHKGGQARFQACPNRFRRTECRV
jgi:hypothetical protein